MNRIRETTIQTLKGHVGYDWFKNSSPEKSGIIGDRGSVAAIGLKLKM